LLSDWLEMIEFLFCCFYFELVVIRRIKICLFRSRWQCLILKNIAIENEHNTHWKALRICLGRIGCKPMKRVW